MDNPAPPNDEPIAAEADSDDILVAYLDGELTAEQTTELERRLAEDPALVRQLRELQKTWDVLDCLPQAITADTFTKSTIELVTRDATREIQRSRRAGPTRWLRPGVLAGVVALAAWGGFQTVRAYQTAPLRQLARDLRIVENLDVYRSIDSLEYLQELEQSGLFVSEEEDRD
jgi:anti-sigma factor RsiW